MTCIEALSNELFYEIFEYLNGCEIYDAFSNLNIRFQNLLTYSSQPLKINLCEKSKFILQKYCEQIIIPYKNRIISLCLIDKLNMEYFFKLITINSSLSRLESLVLNDIDSYDILPSLTSLESLHRLFSLTLQFSNVNLQKFRQIYQTIFYLHVLKYSKISITSDGNSLTSAFFLNYTYISSIERLIINHSCSIKELMRILSHTPKLCYLVCKSIPTSNLKNIVLIPVNLPNLKYISIENCNASFDELEIFFREIHFPIEVLRFKTSQISSYANANKWERLISHYIPHLHSFYLHCSVTFHDTKNFGFSSVFWIERQWVWEFKINVANKSHREFIYLIHPHRKSWCESSVYADNDDNSSIHILQSTELIMTGTCLVEEYQSFIYNHRQLFGMMSISRLNIDYDQLSIELLIKIHRLLPNINSLRIRSFPQDIQKTLSAEVQADFDFISKNNNITKICLCQMDQLSLTHFYFLKVWTRVEYLEMNCKNYVNIEMIIRIILKRKSLTSHLRCLCLCLANINDQMLEKLRTIINLQKLHYNDYTIKLENNKLYMRWK